MYLEVVDPNVSRLGRSSGRAGMLEWMKCQKCKHLEVWLRKEALMDNCLVDFHFFTGSSPFLQQSQSRLVQRPLTSIFHDWVLASTEDGDKTVAFITKGWAGGMQEMFTNANSFYAARMVGMG